MNALAIADANNMVKNLIGIEKIIIALVGDDIGSYNLNRFSHDKIEIIEDLLSQRMRILNDMFRPTDENMLRFRLINQRLFEMTQNLHSRFKIMEAKTSVISDCPEFDDDYVIEGWLRYVFEGAKSVLTLTDDAYYGSQFDLMIKTLYELYEYKELENIESVYYESEPFDDGDSWSEPLFRDKKEFKNIVICHAVHNLTSHKAYSIPDLLRLNNFWCEVQVRVQSLTDQKGNRWKNG